jgi:superoxide reductase
MAELPELIQTADFKSEKHVPVIECADQATAGEPLEVKVSVGAEVNHPNTTEHHIRWIRLYFLPEGGKFPYEVANVEFTVHGESADGANEGPVYTHHAATVVMKTEKPGTLMALSYCNIHGLWRSNKPLAVG